MLVRSKEKFDAVRLNGTKTHYPDWVQWLILKNRLLYYPSERRWVLFDTSVLHDDDYLIREAREIIGVECRDFDNKYEVCHGIIS